MVLGEEQILGQIKNSITSAREVKGIRPTSQYIYLIKQSEWGQGLEILVELVAGGISVGSMAVKLAEENIDELKTKQSIYLIGTGEVSTLVAKSLQRRGYAFNVTSRTIGRSETFCETMGGNPIKFEDSSFRI